MVVTIVLPKRSFSVKRIFIQISEGSESFQKLHDSAQLAFSLGTKDMQMILPCDQAYRIVNGFHLSIGEVHFTRVKYPVVITNSIEEHVSSTLFSDTGYAIV